MLTLSLHIDERRVMFEHKMGEVLDRYKDLNELKDVGMIFFPLTRDRGNTKNQYYVLCINLARPSAYIIDNEKGGFGGNILLEYGQGPGFVLEAVKGFLKDNNHEKAKEFVDKDIEVKLFKLKCAVEAGVNSAQSGIYTMRHMEAFKGEGQNRYDAEIEKDERKQKAICNKLRSKYVNKLMINDINIHSEKMADEGREYEKLPAGQQNNLVMEAITHMEERFALIKELEE